MVGIGFLAFFFGLYFWFRYIFRRRGLFESKLMLLTALALGPLSFAAIELGWMTTEMGRQPWVVYGYVLTKDAVTPAPGLDISFLIFTLIYVALAVATTIFLLRLRGGAHTMAGVSGAAEASRDHGERSAQAPAARPAIPR